MRMLSPSLNRVILKLIWAHLLKMIIKHQNHLHLHLVLFPVLVLVLFLVLVLVLALAPARSYLRNLAAPNLRAQSNLHLYNLALLNLHSQVSRTLRITLMISRKKKTMKILLSLINPIYQFL